MTDSQTIPDQIIARLYEDMASSPVDGVTIISRPQLEALQSAIENSAKAIHDAVMAERERCAAIADDPWEHTRHEFADAEQLCAGVADAIRAAPRAEEV
jgi:hypothetical protein